ncbi:MAG: PLP-dependent aminotransferase family protein [Chloroflexi bacterium]|nr:PLP-dependent aminotransferase family protein [Chloroflexota bacterium]
MVPRTNRHVELPALNPALTTPLFQQVYERLRRAILTGQLPRGTRLPSTRALARELGVARITIQAAFDQLIAEGYIQGVIGSGTYVAPELPEEAIFTDSAPMPAQPARGRRTLSARGIELAGAPYLPPPLITPEHGLQYAFRVGLPALDAFPFALWGRLRAQCWQQVGRETLSYQHPLGAWPLRAAIAAYLGPARGVHCTPEQVIIVAGAQQGIDLVARVLLDPGDMVWLEDPGYLGARGALLAAGARVIPVPVDAEGLQVQAGHARAPEARLAFVTPSHQFPLGVTMSLARRLALLKWASAADAWVLEDDYDSEYRYTGRPLTALQGLDAVGRVIYLGTFSKTLAPALRLGYLVVPNDLVEAFTRARLFTDLHPPILEQHVLATFINDEHYARHIRAMRVLYAKRQQALLAALSAAGLGAALETPEVPAGLHLVSWLAANRDDQALARHAARLGVDVMALSRFAIQPLERPGLLLGFGAVTPDELPRSVQRLAAALQV